MAPKVPLSELVRRASAQLKPPTGIRTGGEQFLPPELEGQVQGFPGSTGIGAPGMRVGDVPPEIDRALLQEAIQPRMGGDSMQLPAAANPPTTMDELELGIETPLVPGSSPYLPHQTTAPSMAEKDPYGLERFKAMNFSMTPVGMRDHFRNLGFEAEVAPHDKFAKAHHPMLEEIVSGEGYNVIIKEPTTGDWHTLDPQSFELADLTDIASDAAITVASIMGANAAGAAAQATRQGAVAYGRRNAMGLATRPLSAAQKAAGGAANLSRELGEEALETGIRRAGPSLTALRGLEEAAATPSTFLGPRVAGAVKWTVPPEAARQGIGAFTDVPEEGGGRRLGRGLMELGASAVGEVADPFMGAKGLLGASSRGDIKRWTRARDFAERYGRPFDKEPPKAFGDILTPDQNADAIRQRLGVAPREVDPDAPVVDPGGPPEVPTIPDDYQGSMEGRTVQSLVPGEAKAGQPSEGPLAQWPGRHQYGGDYTHDNPLQVSSELRKRINAVLRKENRSVDQLKEHELRTIYEIYQDMQGGRIGDENFTPVGFARNADLLDQPVPRQPQSPEGVLARIMERGAEAGGADDIRPTGKQRTYAQKFIDNKRQEWAKLEAQGEAPDPTIRAQQEGVFQMLEKMDENEMFWISGLVELKPTTVIRGTEEVKLRYGEELRPGDTIKGGVEGWQALEEGDLASMIEISKQKQHMVRLGPTFMNVPALKANLDSADGLADIAKMDWEDVVIAADDWRFSADELKRSNDWDEAFDGSDGEQVFRFMLDNMDKEGVDSGKPLTAIEPPDLTKQPAYDPRQHDIMWLWAEISEHGTAEAAGRRRGWVSYKSKSIEVLGREHITEAMPGPEHSTRPRPALERYAAEADVYEEALAGVGRELTPEFSPEGRVATDKPSKKLPTVKQLVRKARKLKKLRAKPEEYEAHLERLGTEQSSRYEAFKEAEAAFRAGRKRKPDGEDPFGSKKPPEQGEPQGPYGIPHPGRKQVIENHDSWQGGGLPGSQKAGLLGNQGPLKSVRDHDRWHKEHRTPVDPLEDKPWAEAVAFNKVKLKATSQLRKEDWITDTLELPADNLLKPGASIEKWVPKKGTSQLSYEQAMKALGGQFHPGFAEEGAVEQLIRTMLTGKVPTEWRAHIWATELNAPMMAGELNGITKTLFDNSVKALEKDGLAAAYYRDFYDPADLVGTAADSYKRWRGFVKDIMLMWRTTPRDARILRRDYMMTEFYNPKHQTGQYRPGTGMFDDIASRYDEFGKGDGFYDWYAGNLKKGSADAVAPGRSKDKIKEIKAESIATLLRIPNFTDEAGARRLVTNAMRTLGEQHPDLERGDPIIQLTLVGDGNKIPADWDWDPNLSLRQHIPGDEGEIRNVQAAHAVDIEKIPADDMLASFERMSDSAQYKLKSDELRHRLKYLGYEEADIQKAGSGVAGDMTHEGAYVRANFGIKKGSKLDSDLAKYEADPDTGEGHFSKGKGEEKAPDQETKETKETKEAGETPEEKKARLKKEKKEAEAKKKKEEDDKEDEEPDGTDDGGGDETPPDKPRDPGDMELDDVDKEIDSIDVSDPDSEDRLADLLQEFINRDEHKRYDDALTRISGSDTEPVKTPDPKTLHQIDQEPLVGEVVQVPKKPKGMADNIWNMLQKRRQGFNEEDILVRGGGEGEESYVSIAHVRGGPQAGVNVSGHKVVTVVEKGSLERDVAFLDPSQPGVSLEPVQIARLAGHKTELTTEGVYIDYGSGQGRRGIKAPGGWQSGWIHEGGPMWNAGVRRGDFVYAINGETPTGHEGMRRLMSEAFKKKGPVEIFLIRSVDGKAKKYKATFEISETDVWREPKRPEVRLREEVEQARADKLDAALKAWDGGDEEIEIGLTSGILPHSYLAAAEAIKGIGEYSGKHKIVKEVIDTAHPALGVKHPELRALRTRMEGWEQGATRDPVHLKWRRTKDGDLVVAEGEGLFWRQKANFTDPLTTKKDRVLDRTWDLEGWDIGQVINLIDAPYLHPAVPVEIRQLAAWSLDDLKALYKKVHGLDWLPEKKRKLPVEARAFMSLQWETGLRMNELLKLSEEDIRAFTPQMLKNSRALKDVHDMLAARKNNRPKKDSNGRRPLFVNKNNTRAKSSTANAYYKNWAAERREGTKTYKNTSHAMRHSIATHMMDMGADISVVKELLGHAEAKRWVAKRKGLLGAARWQMTKVYTEHHRGLTAGQRWLEADEPMTLASREGPRLTGATMEGADPDWEAKTFTIEQMNRIRASEHLSKDTFASKRNKAMLETQYSTGLRNDGLMGRPDPTSELGKKFKGLQVEDFLSLTEEELKIPALKAIHDYLPYREKQVKWLFAHDKGLPPYYMEAKVDSGPLFIGNDGNRFGHKSYTNMLKKVTGEERAWPVNAEGKSLKHPIRHAWATHLIDQSEDLAEIEKFLKAGDIEDLPATPAETSTGLQRAEPSTDDPTGWGHLKDDDLVALHSHYVGEKERIGFEGEGWKEAYEFEKTLKHELEIRAGDPTQLSLFKKGDKVTRDGVQYEIVKADEGVKWRLKNLDVPGGHKDEYVDFVADKTAGFEKVSARRDLSDENHKALQAHVLKRTGKDPGKIHIVDTAIEVLKGHVDKGDISNSYFTELKLDYIGTNKKGPRIATRVLDYMNPDGEVEPVRYISEEKFIALGHTVMEHVNATRAAKDEAWGRLDISKAFDKDPGIEAGEHLLLDSGVNPGDETYVRVDVSGEDMTPGDISKGVDIIYRMYPAGRRAKYGFWDSGPGLGDPKKTGKPTQAGPGDTGFGGEVNDSIQRIVSVGNLPTVQAGGRSSLGHPGTQVFFKSGQSFYRAFFVDPKKGPGVQAVKGYIEILSSTGKRGRSRGVTDTYHRVGTILATGKVLTDYSPGGARAGGVPDQLRLHPGEDAPPGIGLKSIPVAARKTVWHNNVLAHVESFNSGHYKSIRSKISNAQGSREEMIGWAKELLEARQGVVSYLEAMQRGFERTKPAFGGKGKPWGFSRAESDAAEAAGKPWNSPHAVSHKLGVARADMKKAKGLVDELERSVKGLSTVAEAKKLLKKDVTRGTAIAVKGIKENITDLRVVSVGDTVRSRAQGTGAMKSREDYVLYRIGGGSWQRINRSDYETLSLRGMGPMGQLAWDNKKIDKEFVALLHFLGSGINSEGEMVAVARPYRGFVGYDKGKPGIHHGAKPVLGPFRLTRGATYSEPGGMRIVEQLGGQSRASDPTAIYASGAREVPTEPVVVERGVGGGVVRRELKDVKVIEADDLYRQEGRIRVLEEHEQSYMAGDEYVAVLRSAEAQKVKTSRGFAKSGQPGKIGHEVFDIVDDLRAQYPKWDDMKPQTRVKLFNEKYATDYAQFTDKGVDPDVFWSQRPHVDQDYVRTGRYPDIQANYGEAGDYIWYRYDRKKVNAKGEVTGGVVQAALDRGEAPPREFMMGGREGSRKPPMPHVLKERVRKGELVHSGRPEAPWEMSFQEFSVPSAMWRGDAPASKFIYEGRIKGAIPEGSWRKGKIDVSIRSPGFRLDFELDISPIKKITGEGKLKRSRQEVSDEDLARLAWEKLQNKRFRDKVGATEAAKPIEERLVSSFTLEEYESLLIRRAVEIEERGGVMPYRPQVDMDASGKSVKVSPNWKSKQTVNPEINPYLHYEALLHLSGKGDFVGEGTLDAATRNALMAKGGKDWGAVGVSPREGDTRSFLMQTLEERGFVDGKGKLKPKGQATLDMWHAQQLAYDKRMAELRATVKKGLPAKMADHINAELRLGKAKMADLDANLIRELAVHHEHIVGAEHVKGLIPTAIIKEVRSKPVTTAKVKLKLGLAGKDGQGQTVFKYNKKLMTWVDENGKTVDALIRKQDALSKQKPNARQRAVHYSKIDKLIELRDNLDITPSDQIAYRTALPIAKGGKPAVAGDLLKGADLDVPFGENKYAVITRHENGKFSYAVFGSYGHAKGYQSALTPLEGDAVGSRRLFSDIIRGREGFKLGAALEAADYITAGTPLKKSQDYQSVNGQIERLKFRSVQMDEAATDLHRQILEADELFANNSNATITIKLPRWEPRALGIETAPGKPSELITSLKYKPGTYSEGVSKVADEDYWDATATGYRTYTVVGEENVDALIDKAVKRYNTLVEKEMRDVAGDLHGLIGERTGTKQPVVKPEPGIVSPKKSTKARETLNIDKKTGRVVEEGELRPLGDQLKDKADEATGGFANVSTLLGVTLVGAVAATVGDVGGEVFQGVADGVATFLKTAFLQVTGDGAITFKQSLAALGTGGFVLAEGLGKSLRDIASRSTKKAKDMLIGLRDKAGNIIKKLPPEERARGMKTELQVEPPSARSRREKKHIGRLVGDEATVALKSVDNDIFEFPRPNEGMVSRWTKADGKHFDLSKHSANPIKVPIIPRYGVKLNARNQPPYDANKVELRRLITDATNALARDGWTVTEATWGATFKGNTGVKMHGLIISKPGVVTPVKVQQHIDRAWSAPAHREWDIEGIKLHQEAEEILNELPQEYREAFITWWQHERGAQDTEIRGRYTGVKQEYKFWKAVSDYSTGRKTLKLARRKLHGRKHERFAMRSEYGPHTVPKEEAFLYRSYDEVMRRDAPDIEYRSASEKEAAELGRREEVAAAHERGDYIDPTVEAWVDDMMRSIDGLDTPKGRALAKAMKLAEQPELHGLVEGIDAEAKLLNFRMLPGGERQKIRQAFMKEMEVALKEFLDSPEGDNWQTWLYGLSQKLHGFSDASKGLIGKGAWRNIQGVLRFARAFWRGSRLSSFGRFMWKVDAVKQASRSLAKIFQELATEPNRAKARALFMESGDLLGRIPDKIKRGLGLPPFEEEYARNMTKNVPLNWIRWAAKRMGIDMPTGMQRKGLEAITGGGAGPGVAEARSTVSRVTGAKPSGVVGSSRPRIGATRYIDRPLIKEEMHRTEHIISERRKKKKKRELRLPRKLQRSS